MSAPAVAAIPALQVTGHLSVPALLGIVAVEGALRGPADAAKYSLCPRIADAAGRPLERVTGYAATLDRLAGTVGAALGGVVIAAVGAPTALLCACPTFLLSAAIMSGAVAPRLTSAPTAPPVSPPGRGPARGG